MPELAINKLAIAILTAITLITLIFLFYFYYSEYLKSQENINTAQNQSWNKIKKSSTCLLENYLNILNITSNKVKHQKLCTETRVGIKNIGENVIELYVECIKKNTLTSSIIIELCDVYYYCENKEIQIKSCKVK